MIADLQACTIAAFTFMCESADVGLCIDGCAGLFTEWGYFTETGEFTQVVKLLDVLRVYKARLP